MCRVKTAVQIQCADHCLHHVRGNRIAVASTGRLLAFSKQHVASQLDIPCAVRKRWLTDHRGTQLRKLSFRHLRILMEKKIAGNQLQHSISQKLQPLVVL